MKKQQWLDNFMVALVVGFMIGATQAATARPRRDKRFRNTLPPSPSGPVPAKGQRCVHQDVEIRLGHSTAPSAVMR
jgi:hypothetical protein